MSEYYVSSLGNDNNSGSLNSPFKSFERARQLSLAKGDKVLFKCAETFPLNWSSNRYLNWTMGASGEAENPIIIGSYGSGNKPILDARQPMTFTWTQHATNIWKTIFNGTYQINRVILNGNESAQASNVVGIDGIKYLWFYDMAAFVLYLYAAANPSSVYSDIRPVVSGNFLWMNGKSFWTIQDIEFRGQGDGVLEMAGIGGNITLSNITHKYSSWFSVWVEQWTSPNISNILIDGCEFDTCLNLVDRVVGDDRLGVLTGDMICNRGGGSDWIIRNNKFINFGHSAVGVLQGNAAGAGINGWLVENNLFTAPKSPYSRAYGIDGVPGKCRGHIFRKNIISDVCVRTQIGGEDNILTQNIFDYVRKTETTGRGNVANAVCLYAYGTSVCDRNTVSHNIFRRTSMEAVWFNKWNDINNNVVSNNIFIDCGMDTDHPDVAFYAQAGINGTNLIKDNCFWKRGASKMIDWAETHYTVGEANAQLPNFSGNVQFPVDVLPDNLGIGE